MVVGFAEQDQVVQAGRSAVGPVPDVVGMQLRGPVFGAAGHGAAAVAGHQSSADAPVDSACGAADIEDFAAVFEDRDEGGVTGQPAGLFARELPTGSKRGQPGAGITFQCLRVDGHDELNAGVGIRVAVRVEEGIGQSDQGSCERWRGRSGRIETSLRGRFR